MPDSGKVATDKLQAPNLSPKLIIKIPGQVSYGTEFKGVVKVESANPFATTISADSKPDWLDFRSGVFLNLYAGSTALGTANGPRLSARFYAPCALAQDSDGNLYIADQADNRIRKIDVSGMVSTVAGSVSGGFKDGSSTEARFDSPFGIAIAASGTLFITDQENNSIRSISSNGVVATLTGGSESGYVDGIRQEAKFKSPGGICIDSKGFLYVADRGNHRIRMISPEGIVTTLAGSGEPGFADGKGSSAKFSSPTGVAVDSAGYVYVTDQVNNRIRKISPEGVVTTLAGSGEFSKRDGIGKGAAFRYPTGIVLDANGVMYVTDQLNHLVRRVSTNGEVSTITPSSSGTGLAEGLMFKNPMGICLNNEGNIMVADFNNHCIKEISAEATLAGTPAKTQLGAYNLVLKAADQYGSAVEVVKVLVKDTIAPVIIRTFPENGSTGIGRNIDLVLNFDKEIKLNKTGAVTISSGTQVVKKYDFSEPLASHDISISADQNSVILKIQDLPASTSLLVSIGNGIVSDTSGNVFKASLPSSASWVFTTKAKQMQTIDVPPIPLKIYGDQPFAIGPMQSSAGLPVQYYAIDPGMLKIVGDSARILKAGSTKIIALQVGDSENVEKRVEIPVVVNPREISIRPIPGQSMFVGEFVPAIKFVVVSGTVLQKDAFSGSLQKAPGDSVGVYPINLGTLTLGENYLLKLEAGTFEIKTVPVVVANKPPVSCTNLISANADGINDRFIVRNIGYYPGNELKIVDRSGTIVFKQRNYENNWDGTFRGATLPTGTYYYLLDLGEENGQLKGYLSLVE